jgi:hypothetical protein
VPRIGTGEEEKRLAVTPQGERELDRGKAQQLCTEWRRRRRWVDVI